MSFSFFPFTEISKTFSKKSPHSDRISKRIRGLSLFGSRYLTKISEVFGLFCNYPMNYKGIGINSNTGDVCLSCLTRVCTGQNECPNKWISFRNFKRFHSRLFWQPQKIGDTLPVKIPVKYRFFFGSRDVTFTVIGWQKMTKFRKIKNLMVSAISMTLCGFKFYQNLFLVNVQLTLHCQINGGVPNSRWGLGPSLKRSCIVVWR